MTNCFNTLKINFFNPIVDYSEFKNEKLLESYSSKGVLESRYNLGSWFLFSRFNRRRWFNNSSKESSLCF
jgi:hypothetical protein